MLFIGFAIVVAIGLALLVSADAGTLVGITQEQLLQAIPLGVILLVIAGGLFSRRHRFSELAGSLVAWVGIFGVVLVGYAFRDDLSLVASRVFGELVPGVAVVDEERGTASFRGGRDGHFIINARVNGEDVRTIFDTGASAVVLTHRDAERVGISTAALDYSVTVSTANGAGRAAAVTLDRIEIGGIVRNNVRAFIAEPDMLNTSLLGMSYLGTLSRYAVSGNSLELVD